MSESSQSVEEYEHAISPALKALIAFLLGISGTLLFAWLTGDVFGTVLNSIRTTIFYNLVPFLVAGFLGIYLVYKSKIVGVHGMEFLATFVLAISLSEIFKIAAGESLLNTSPFRRDGSIFALLNDMMMPVAVLALYLHIELIENQRPNLLRSIGIFSSGLPLIVGGVLQIVVSNTDLLEDFTNNASLGKELENVLTFYLYIFGIIILWISIYGLKVMYLTMAHADSPEVSRGSILMIIGFSSLIGNFVLLGLRDTLSLSDVLPLGVEFTVHTSWLMMGSIFFFLLAYFLTPEFAYSVPFDVYQLLVINREDGVTLFSFINEIRNPDKPSIQVALKSPAIVAIQTLLKEITYAEGTVNLIGMSDRQLVLRSSGPVTSVLIAENSSYFLNKGLEDFTEAFYKQFRTHIENFTGNVKVFENSKALLKKFFPFFRKESL